MKLSSQFLVTAAVAVGPLVPTTAAALDPPDAPVSSCAASVVVVAGTSVKSLSDPSDSLYR